MPTDPANLAAKARADSSGDGGTRALFRDAKNGDRGAFGRIVLQFQDRIYNTLLRLVGDADEARDLTQESFAKALAKISSFRGDSQPFTWLYRIALNLGLTHLSKNKRRRTFSLDAVSNPLGRRSDDQASALMDRIEQQRLDSPGDAALRRERQQQVLSALGRIDPQNRALLVLRDIDGLDYQAMADVLEMPLGTLKSKLFRARLALREELKSYWTE
jgi:RNA polymerase sigma-70 factor, ECF subfamily